MMNQFYSLFLSLFIPLLPSHFNSPSIIPAITSQGMEYTPLYFDFSLQTYDPKQFDLAKKKCADKLAQRIDRHTKRYAESFWYYCTFYGEILNEQVYSLDTLNKLKIAANDGSAEAAYELGDDYFYGLPSWGDDYKQSRQWYKVAADRGLVKAQYELAHFYEEGWGGDVEPAKAMALYEKLANDGDLDAQTKLGDKYFVGDHVTQDYTKSFYWKEKAAEQGDGGAAYNIGMMYYNGLGVSKDYKKAFAWFVCADQKKIREAEYALGMMYQIGNAVPKNRIKARHYLKQACNDFVDDACVQYKKMAH